MSSISVMVVGLNANGAPAVVRYHVEATAQQIIDGEHYEIAKTLAAEAGYQGPLVAADQDDELYRTIETSVVQKALANFGANVLSALEDFEEWDSEFIDEVASLAEPFSADADPWQLSDDWGSAVATQLADSGVDSDLHSVLEDLRGMARLYEKLMAERERAEKGEGDRSVEKIDEEIDELLGETMAESRKLLDS